MRTLTHQLLAAYIAEKGGEAAWTTIQQMAGSSARETDRHHTVALLKQLSIAQQQPLDDVLYLFGTSLISAPLLALRAPDLLLGCATARDFFLGRAALLERLVLQELADAPSHVWSKDCALDLVEVDFQGRGEPLCLCCLLAGMLVGVGVHFKTPLELHEIACQSQGEPACRLVVRFPTLSSTGSRPPGGYSGRPAASPERISGSQRGHSPRAEEPTREERDLAVLHLLMVKASKRGLTQPEIMHELERFPFTAPYANLEEPLALCLARLCKQGYLMGEVPPSERGGDAASLEYRVTPPGAEHLRLFDQHATA